ncbi:MAG: Aryl-alcohol dehydrogenase [Phenylobacterium sp.]|jgi:hypothetical protein|nr:Aryl-alcohol dehydrogenase [Phenylobacterium sp.]
MKRRPASGTQVVEKVGADVVKVARGERVAITLKSRLPFDRLITTFPFDQINQAIQVQHRGECVKVVILMDG